MHVHIAHAITELEGASLRRKQARWYRTSRTIPAHRHHHRPRRLHYQTWS